MIILIGSDLRPGIYYLREVDYEDRQRFLAGLFQAYPSYSLDDFVTISKGSTMMVIVLPKVILLQSV